MPISKVIILQPHSLKNIIRTLPIRVSKLFQSFIKSSMIFSNGLIIVIDYNNHVRPKHCRIVESFQSLSPTQRTITDYSDDVFFATCEITSFCKSHCQ